MPSVANATIHPRSWMVSIQANYGKFRDGGDGFNLSYIFKIGFTIYHIGLTGQASHLHMLGYTWDIEASEFWTPKAWQSSKQCATGVACHTRRAWACRNKPGQANTQAGTVPNFNISGFYTIPQAAGRSISSPIFGVSADDCESTDWDNACSLGGHGSTSGSSGGSWGAGGSSMGNFDLQEWLVWDEFTKFTIEPSYFAIPFKGGKWC